MAVLETLTTFVSHLFPEARGAKEEMKEANTTPGTRS